MNKPSSFAEYLETHETLTYTNVGVSMLPLLHQGRDLFTVRRKGPERCKAGDVVLYRRPPNQYVLHRVIEVRPKDYVIMGDNCVTMEYGIRDEDILGIMTGYVRKGKEHSVEERGYRLYSIARMRTIGLRIFLKRARAWLVKRIRRVLCGFLP